MNTTTITQTSLQELPGVIWMPGDPPSMYRGSPLDMVKAMGEEMEPKDLAPREVIETLVAGLLRGRGVYIALPNVKSDETLARLFIFALLDLKIGKRMAAA